jgi:hypothetical protein
MPKFKAILAAIILALSFAGPVAAGPLEDGEAAYQRGDYATALRLLRPLADQGLAIAQLNLSYMYTFGQPTRRSTFATVCASHFRRG